MASFEEAYKKTAKWEGGYCDVAGDAGGETICGIARNAWGKSFYILFEKLDKIKAEVGKNAKAINERVFNDKEMMDQIHKFYKANFWDKIRGDEIGEQSKANALYDFCVNSGTSRGIKKAQEVCGVALDGVFGAKTLQAINEKENFTNILCDARSEFFKAIAQKGQNAKFLNGWLNRVKDFYA